MKYLLKIKSNKIKQYYLDFFFFFFFFFLVTAKYIPILIN